MFATEAEAMAFTRLMLEEGSAVFAGTINPIYPDGSFRLHAFLAWRTNRRKQTDAKVITSKGTARRNKRHHENRNGRLRLLPLHRARLNTGRRQWPNLRVSALRSSEQARKDRSVISC